MRKQGHQLSQEQVDNILSLYRSGKTIKEISEITGSTKDTVSLYLQENGIIVVAKGRQHSEETIKEIVDAYNGGMNIVSIAKEYGIGRHVVAKYVNIYLTQNGLDRRNDAFRKYSINENYFDIIDTPNKAYILGFLYADGYNSVSKSTVTMSLQEGDKYILEAMNKEMENTAPLRFVEQSKRLGKDSPYNYEDLWQLNAFSIHMCESLEDKGVKQNKSLILTFPEWLDANLYSHFVRGCIDGDGSISYNVERNQAIVTLTSSEQFCVGLKSYLNNNGIIPGGGIHDASCHNGITKVFVVGGNTQCEKFCNWIYSDADMKLERKYEKYLQIKNRPKKVA